jgi:hypothetical protein
MGGIAGVPHQGAVRALQKAGFMAGVVRDAGLTPEEFRKLL